MNGLAHEATPISWGVSSKMRVVFKSDKIKKYRALGVVVEHDGSTIFGGHFQSFENSKPCFKLTAAVSVEIFNERKEVHVPLTWSSEDVVSVGFAFSKEKFYWKAEWTTQELAQATQC
jgi:hypothetical protein